MKRIYLIASACILLCACGGGGGGGGGTTPVPQPTATLPPVPTSQSERVDAQNALSAYQASSAFSSSGGTPALSAGRRIEAFMNRRGALSRRNSTTACTNGIITTTTQTSSTTLTITVDSYYDLTCTHLREELVWSAAIANTTAAGPFTDTEYTNAGSVGGYRSGNLSFTFNSALTAITAISILMSDIATSQTAPSIGELGLACALSSSVSCGVAAVENVASGGEQGVNLNVSGSETAGANGTYSVQITLNAQAYTGASNSMTIAQGTLPAWTISGGTLFDSLTGNANVAYAANGIPTSAAVNLTDPQYNTTVSLTATQNGLTGLVQRGSTTYATFSVDLSGNGTITYDGGATGQIQNWLIVS